MLCALATRLPGHGFGCTADRFHPAKLDDLLALPSETPIVLSIDLDQAVQRNDRSMRVEQLVDVGHAGATACA